MYTSLHISHLPPNQSFIFQLGEADMDSIVCAVSSRKTIAKVQKDYEDLVGVVIALSQ